MYKFLKAVVILITLSICITIIVLHIEGKFDDRPFKFEVYRTEESFEEAIKSNFALGSNIEDALDILVISGATCKLFDHRGDKAWIKNINTISHLVVSI